MLGTEAKNEKQMRVQRFLGEIEKRADIQKFYREEYK